MALSQKDNAPDAADAKEYQDKKSNEIFKPYGEDGPTSTVIEELKDKWGDLEIIYLGGRYWIYRQMKREEHLRMVEDLNTDLDNDSVVVNTMLVWPDPKTIDWEDQPAGVIPSLSAEILRFAGFIQTRPPTRL